METNSAKVHEQRRAPRTPTAPVQLDVAATELLERARELRSARAAQNLVPGAGAPLTQSLLALCAGAHLQEHTSPGSPVPGTRVVARPGQAPIVHGAAARCVHDGWRFVP